MTHSGATYFGSGRVRLDQPLAYRDEQGNLQLYKPGEAPTILVSARVISCSCDSLAY
ncbi:hypothetical protein DPMN_142725 [Dreissena polymorpha]|uniref:Uncharacterized protein n=1 Tax=Dreissena polymorpha TaxID=45954 RepID=A0A9D4GBM6_DREPO|nr:hypothetical protein DPMN_142725 [Dreissena polymorpha]